MQITHKGRTVPVTVDDNGTFHAELGKAGSYQASSLHDLRELVEKAMNQDALKIAVPFTVVSRGTILAGTATGLHARTGRVLVRWGDGTSTQESRSELRDAQRALDATESAELAALLDAQRAANAAVRAFTGLHAMDVLAAVNAALSKAGA